MAPFPLSSLGTKVFTSEQGALKPPDTDRFSAQKVLAIMAILCSFGTDRLTGGMKSACRRALMLAYDFYPSEGGSSNSALQEQA